MSRTLHLSVAIVMLWTAGCSGAAVADRFQLLKRLVGRHDRAHEVAVLLEAVAPVYTTPSLDEAVMVGSMEFWSGLGASGMLEDQPSRRRIARGPDEVLLTRIQRTDDRVMTLEFFQRGEPYGLLRFEQPDNAPTLVRDGADRVIMSAQTLENGALRLNDNSGRQVATYVPPE